MLPHLGRRLGRRLPALSGLVAAGLLVASLTAPASADDPALSPEPTAEPTPAAGAEHASVGAEPSAEVAQQALAQVQDALDPSAAPADEAAPADQGDLTMALRDLRANRAALPRADRAAAARVLSGRPDADWSNPHTQQFGSVLVHWNGNSVTQGYVDLVGAVSTHVLSTYAAAGYRAPKSDGPRGGGSGLVDIYLADLDPGYYGYCDTDQQPPQQGPYDAPAYCAFDDDYAPSEFPQNTPTQNLQVTAAHELFHAVQFAYDYLEDQWFMEATAVWAEDEVYDGINDNRQYLAISPLAQPRQSLDQFSPTTLRHYGSWIFFRYLSERYPAKLGSMPVIMRRLWARVDGSAGGPDNYSMQAIKRELATRNTSLRPVFARFADANRRPGRTYSEGKAYPVAPPSTTWRLAAGRSTGWQTLRLNHLAATSVRVVPGAGTTASAWRARFTLDLPRPSRGAAAIIALYRTDGSVATKAVSLDRLGRGVASVPFSSRRVARVEVTLVNAGSSYACWQGPVNGVTYSCSGVPQDNRLPFSYTVRAVR